MSSSTALMLGGLVASYGTCAATGARFLYPATPARRGWQYLARLDDLKRGEALSYRAPNGETIVVARRGEAGTAEDFIALSSTCPHLGCKVSWEAHRNRFFCPCHNGVFDSSGKPRSGPPADAGQELFRFPLKLEQGLLYIEVPLEGLPV